jgi:hypothetical protein
MIMSVKLSFLWKAATIVGCLILESTLAGYASPRSVGVADSALYRGSSQNRNQRKQGKGAESPNVWIGETTIQRPPKPGRPRRIKAALLTLEYRIIKQAEDGAPVETSPNVTFITGDQVQLRIKTNQNGYLHIIQSNEGEDGQIIFPDSRVNNGESAVNKNEERIVPFNCESKRKDNCWLQFEPPAGREIFWVIFSREAVPEIISQVTRPGGMVKWPDLVRIKENATIPTSRPHLSPQQGGGAGRYIQWVTNIDKSNNEQLIKKVSLNHQER